jgi:hypothetical protein
MARSTMVTQFPAQTADPRGMIRPEDEPGPVAETGFARCCDTPTEWPSERGKLGLC